MAERPFLNKKKYLRYEPGPRLWEKLTKIKELTDLLLNKEQSIRKTRDFFYLSCPTGKEQSLINENNAKKDSYQFCQLLKIQVQNAILAKADLQTLCNKECVSFMLNVFVIFL